jgi:hypothetical protein
MGAAVGRTNLEEHASAPNGPDLNTSYDITQTTNADGTMGPQTSQGNYANSLPPAQKGYIDFNMANPGYSGSTNYPSPSSYPSKAYYPSPTIYYAPNPCTYPPAQTANNKGKGSNKNNGPQDITNLVLCVKKVEVHLAYLGTPGAPKPSDTPVDRWETLGISDPTKVDILADAQTTAASQLGLTELAAGRYTQVRIYVRSAYATLTDGTVVTLDIPGKSNTVKVVKTFTIEPNKTLKLTLDVDPSHSVIKTGNGYMLRPVVAKIVDEN